MLDVIQHLLELQELDVKIIDAERMLETLPDKKKKLEAKVRQLEERCDQLAARDKDTQKERHNLDVAIKAEEEKIDKYLKQQMDVKTNKEYQAITHEIETTRDAIGELEEKVLEMMEAEEQAEQEKQRADKKLKEAEEKAAVEKKGIDAQIESYNTLMEELTSKRDSLRTRIDIDALDRYDILLERFPGKAVVEVKNGYCLGCNMDVTPQVLVEVRQQEKMTFCNHCLRILSRAIEDKKEEKKKKKPKKKQAASS